MSGITSSFGDIHFGELYGSSDTCANIAVGNPPEPDNDDNDPKFRQQCFDDLTKRSKHDWQQEAVFDLWTKELETVVFRCSRCGAIWENDNKYYNDAGEERKNPPQCDPDDTRLTRYRLFLLRKVEQDEQWFLNNLWERGNHALRWLEKGKYIESTIDNDRYGSMEFNVYTLTWRGREAIVYGGHTDRSAHDWNLDTYIPDNDYSSESIVDVCSKCGATRRFDLKKNKFVYTSMKRDGVEISGSPPCVRRNSDGTRMETRQA